MSEKLDFEEPDYVGMHNRSLVYEIENLARMLRENPGTEILILKPHVRTELGDALEFIIKDNEDLVAANERLEGIIEAYRKAAGEHADIVDEQTIE